MDNKSMCCIVLGIFLGVSIIGLIILSFFLAFKANIIKQLKLRCKKCGHLQKKKMSSSPNITEGIMMNQQNQQEYKEENEYYKHIEFICRNMGNNNKIENRSLFTANNEIFKAFY